MSIEDDYLMLSGIQHFYFCKRQWGLIHINQQWQENEYTIEGQFIHTKVDNPLLKEKRKDIFISRAMHVFSKELGLVGILDAVEFHKDSQGIQVNHKRGKWKPYIVEYKRGKPKKDNRDIIQLVAEVICLEETLGCKIDKSYLYYHSTNNKQEIEITKSLRAEVISYAKQMHIFYSTGKLPKAEYFRNCQTCSLVDVCMPRLSKKSKNTSNYIKNAIMGDEVL